MPQALTDRGLKNFTTEWSKAKLVVPSMEEAKS